MYATLALPAALAPRTERAPIAERPPIGSADALRRALREAECLPRPPDASALDRILLVDQARGLVEAQGGATWRALAEELAREAAIDLAAFAGDSSLPATLGESLAQNPAGPDGLPIVAHIESFTLVTPDGELRRVSRLQHAELFALAVGGRSAFGVPYSITLRLASLARSAAQPARTEVLELEPAAGAPRRRLRLFVAPGRLERLLADARACSAQWQVPLLRIEVRAAAAETQTRLRWARQDCAVVTLDLRVPCGLAGSVRAIEAQRALIDAALAAGGGFELAPDGVATRAQLLACHPDFATFLAEKRRYDPRERLQSDWYRNYRALFGGTSCNTRWS